MGRWTLPALEVILLFKVLRTCVWQPGCTKNCTKWGGPWGAIAMVPNRFPLDLKNRQESTNKATTTAMINTIYIYSYVSYFNKFLMFVLEYLGISFWTPHSNLTISVGQAVAFHLLVDPMPTILDGLNEVAAHDLPAALVPQSTTLLHLIVLRWRPSAVIVGNHWTKWI